MQRRCSVPAEDLIVYSDGDLDAERRAEIEAHLKTCWACRQRLMSSEDIGRMLRARFPLQDNPDARAEIMSQVRAIAAAREQPPAARRFNRLHTFQRWPAVATACLALVIVIAIGLPVTTMANLNLGRYITFEADRESTGPAVVAGDREPPGTPLNLDNLPGTDHGPVSFRAIKPERLPFDLKLVEATTNGEHLLNLVYTDGQGTIVHLTQEPAERSTASASTERTETTYLGDTEALIQYTSIDTISKVIWKREGVVFDLWVVKSVGMGVAENGMVDIVRAVIDAQKSGETQ